MYKLIGYFCKECNRLITNLDCIFWQRPRNEDYSEGVVSEPHHDYCKTVVEPRFEEGKEPPMQVKIRWRCDNEEVFTTDEWIYHVKDWAEVLHHIEQIEAHHTVLSVERVDIQ